jgi:hypothetical protein
MVSDRPITRQPLSAMSTLTCWLVRAVVVVLLAAPWGADARVSKRPNFVFILADDTGSVPYLSCSVAPFPQHSPHAAPWICQTATDCHWSSSRTRVTPSRAQAQACCLSTALVRTCIGDVFPHTHTNTNTHPHTPHRPTDPHSLTHKTPVHAAGTATLGSITSRTIHQRAEVPSL